MRYELKNLEKRRKNGDPAISSILDYDCKRSNIGTQVLRSQYGKQN